MSEHTEGRRNILREKSYSLAVEIVSLCRQLKESKVEACLVNQLLRSGTAKAANIEEGNGANSKAEFSTKISIAFKEARETQYWVRLLYDSQSLRKDSFQELNERLNEVLRIMWAILKKTRM